MKIVVRTDTWPRSPREDYAPPDVMFCQHRRYQLGDEDANDPRELDPATIAIRIPLYLYDHSGITISHAPFSCPWDSGQVGEHYMLHSKVDEEFNGDLERARRFMDGQLKTYDYYLRGECWQWTTLDDADEEIETMAGYYGDSLEATGMQNDVPAEVRDALDDAWEERFS
jgi:hypothetical protein